MPDSVMHMLRSVTPLDLKQLSRQQKVDLLSQYRTGNYRAASAVLFLATDLLASGSTGLSAGELYEVYEQVLIASLDCGKISNAWRYLNLLEKRFGRKSSRVMKLRGLCLEAEGSVEQAKRQYATIQKENPFNDFAIKRLSAIYKGQCKYQDAINVLENDKIFTDEEDRTHTLLEVHRGDALQTYKELSNLYYLIGNIDKAIDFAEEASLFDTDSYYSHVRLAELFYMKKDLHRATVEYAQSLLLNRKPNNTRAAYGLWLVSNEILKLHHTGTNKLKEEGEMRELREAAAEALRSMYAGSPTLSYMETFLKREVLTIEQ